MNMNKLLTTTALATVLILGGTGLAATQTQATPQGQPQAGATQLQGVALQLRQSEQSLRRAQQQLSGGEGNQQHMQQARQAVARAQQVLGEVPQERQGQEAFRKAKQQLTEAERALGGAQPNREQASSRMGEAVEAIATLQREMGGGSVATTSGSASGAQVAVQQRAPQVTVQQPRPEVTVQQPRPEVTVQQAQPQVRVQQAEPQVTVERQGQPQVTVERQGQPQVNVQRQGEAQVNVERERQQQQQAATGTTVTPAPAPSRSTQRTATTPSAGVPLASVSALVGTNVVGATGQDAGEVENLLIDKAGNVRAAVVEWGGFLGIGQRRAMVPIEQIELGAGGQDRARLNMTREELEALPRYDRNNINEYANSQGWGEGVRLHR
jgi:hypothetical protein